MTEVDPRTRRLSIATAPRRNSRHWENGRTTWSDLLEMAGQSADEIGTDKEAGNYLLGRLRETETTHTKRDGTGEACTGLHRSKRAVSSRSALALDVDYPESGFIEDLGRINIEAVVHTTWRSTPAAPRYRLLVLTDRDMTPDEYVVVARDLMNRLGSAQFDRGSYQPERYMFRPSAQDPANYRWWHIEGDPLRVESSLAGYTEDFSTVPAPRPSRTKRVPTEIDGVVGAFNRAYADLEHLIDTFDLPYVASGPDRWQLVGAKSQAGMGPIAGAEGLYFSHHANDPAFEQTCSAFDLVRLHRFGELDDGLSTQTPINRLPSHKAMTELATVDAAVIGELVGLDFADDDYLTDDGDDDDDAVSPNAWRLNLRLTQRGVVKDEIFNWDLIARNWEPFLGLYYDDMAMSVMTDRDLPWRPISDGGPEFGTVDRHILNLEIEREFRVRPPRGVIEPLVDEVARRRYVNPVREYLDGLEWDGKPRLETCLPGVEPDEFTRLVARKSLVAAVARVYEPGIKWDHSLVLYGAEGLGKTFWVDRMSRGWSAPLGPIGEKDTLLTMQRSWIITSDEGHSLRKSDADAAKEFLTRREDVFRAPYDRETRAHPRRTVIWSTTNDETFLRRQEGNRRYLIVKCETKVDFDALTDEYVDQVWAEARDLYRAGEVLHMSDDEAVLAADRRAPYIEEDALVGVVETYLRTLVPSDWEDRSVPARQGWLDSRAEDLVEAGTDPIDRVCTAQVWAEGLGRTVGTHRRVDLLDIGRALRDLGWESTEHVERVGPYGPQRVYRPGPEWLLRLADEEGIL